MMTSEHPGPIGCAWCAAELKRGNLQSPLSHGICLTCMAAASGNPIEDLSHLPPELLDALPFGAIQLSGDGTITAYNRGESALSGLAPNDVIGKNLGGGFRGCEPRVKTGVQNFASSLNSPMAPGWSKSSWFIVPQRTPRRC